MPKGARTVAELEAALDTIKRNHARELARLRHDVDAIEAALYSPEPPKRRWFDRLIDRWLQGK